MNFTDYRFYLAVPDYIGNYQCIRVRKSDYNRPPFSRVIAIRKTWPKIFDRFKIFIELYPMYYRMYDSKKEHFIDSKQIINSPNYQQQPHGFREPGSAPGSPGTTQT
jgi:hypothetical protein